jgi:ABC-type bacteriocin/lantibiotic exporter with double-glycine peptidase domain
VLILDEPTAHLDEQTAAEIVAILRQLTAGRTVLLIAHDRCLHELAGQTAVLADGRVTSSVPHQWAGSPVRAAA